MINFKKPLLAASLMPANVEHSDANILAAMQKLRYPVLATLKLDGIRAIKLDKLVSRTLKPIPNRSIQARAMKLPAGFDMELYNPALPFDIIDSIVMSREHPRSDEIQFHVLDTLANADVCNYHQRMYWMAEWMKHNWNEQNDIKFSYPIECIDANILFLLFRTEEDKGGEGICFRTLNSPYKQGRSTLKEQYLVKLCRNLTSEAVIIGFEEAMENINPEQRNATGQMDRSSHGHNMIGKNTLGALVVRDSVTQKEFKIGTGFDADMRKYIWSNTTSMLNKIVTYKFKAGGKLLPRCPVFKSFRKDL